MEHKEAVHALSDLAGQVSETTPTSIATISGQAVTVVWPTKRGGCSNSLVFGVWWKLNGRRSNFHKVLAAVKA